MDIKGDKVTHTSDYFDQIYELAIKMIKSGMAYADDTEQAQVGSSSTFAMGLWTDEITDARRAGPGHRIEASGRDS